MTWFSGDPAMRRGIDGLLVSGLLAALAGPLTVIGARGRRSAGVVGSAGLVVGTVSRQQDKRVAFAASGWTSMAYPLGRYSG